MLGQGNISAARDLSSQTQLQKIVRRIPEITLVSFPTLFRDLPTSCIGELELRATIRFSVNNISFELRVGRTRLGSH